METTSLSVSSTDSGWEDASQFEIPISVALRWPGMARGGRLNSIDSVF